MKNKPIEFISYNCGIGAKNDDCALGPDLLRQSDLISSLAKIGINAQWTEKYISNNLEMATIYPRNLIIDYTLKLRQQVEAAINKNRIPCTIGGDHSMAIGTWSAVAFANKIFDRMGLIWIDAHMDAHTISTSKSKAYHGTPLSYLLGYAQDDITCVTDDLRVVDPENMVLIGVRSFERAESAQLRELGVKVFHMKDVQSLGFDNVFTQAKQIAMQGTKGFGLSIDLDAFDTKYAPGVNTPKNPGLIPEQVLNNIKSIGKDKLFRGLEIAEFNPVKDKNNLTLNLIKDIVLSVFA